MSHCAFYNQNPKKKTKLFYHCVIYDNINRRTVRVNRLGGYVVV